MVPTTFARYQAYQNLAARRFDANLRVDLDSGELRARRSHFLNRTVDWIRDRLSNWGSRGPGEVPRAQLGDVRRSEYMAAHNHFLDALKQSRRYTEGELSRAQGLLAQEVEAGRPLSTRKVREVFNELHVEGSEVMAINRGRAAEVAGMMPGHPWLQGYVELEMNNRPLLAQAQTEFTREEKDAFREHVHDALVAFGAGDPTKLGTERELSRAEMKGIADRLITDLLNRREAGLMAKDILESEVAQAAGQGVVINEQQKAELGRRIDAALLAEVGGEPPDLSEGVGRHGWTAFTNYVEGAGEPPLTLEDAKDACVDVVREFFLGVIDEQYAALEAAKQRNVERVGREQAALGPTMRPQKNSAEWVIGRRLDGWYREALAAQGADAEFAAAAKAPDELKSLVRGMGMNREINSTKLALGPSSRAVEAEVRQTVAEFLRAHASVGVEPSSAMVDRMIENNLDGWYREALVAEGGRKAAAKGEGAPEALKAKVRASVLELALQPESGDALDQKQVAAHIQAQAADFVRLSPSPGLVAAKLNATLAGAGLPKEVDAQAKDLLKTGQLNTEGKLATVEMRFARAVNKKTSEWAEERRIGNWYQEAVEARTGKKIRSGVKVNVPGTVLHRVAKFSGDRNDLIPYPEFKASARAIAVEFLEERPEAVETAVT